MHFGVAYYPEQWPRGRWEEDARMMKQAGINLVRMAVRTGPIRKTNQEMRSIPAG